MIFVLVNYMLSTYDAVWILELKVTTFTLCSIECSYKSCPPFLCAALIVELVKHRLVKGHHETLSNQ